MFSALKQLFQGTRDPAEENLTGRKNIAAILRQLKAEHQLLSVTVPGHKHPANSAILSVKEDSDRFFLDELNTAEAHLALVKTGKAGVRCRLQGMEISFNCKLLKAGKKDGIALYEMEVPASITRLQRRQHFRLRLGSGLMVPISIPRFDGKAVAGEAFDLSAGGVGLYLKSRKLPDRGQMLYDLSISIPHFRPLQTNAEIRFASLDGAHHMLRLGVRFNGLDRQQERQLARFLAEQQRKRRRYNPR